jgi:hypothetical protein
MTAQEAKRIYALYNQERERLAHVHEMEYARTVHEQTQQTLRTDINNGRVALYFLPLAFVVYLGVALIAPSYYRYGHEWPVSVLLVTGLGTFVVAAVSLVPIYEGALDVWGKVALLASLCLIGALGVAPTFLPDVARPCYGLLTMLTIGASAAAAVACGIGS